MNIAIDTSPLHDTKNSVRGSGFYIANLRRSLLEYVQNNNYVFYDKNIPVNIDVLHIPYFHPFFFYLPIIKRHKTVVTIHDLIPLIFPQHFPAGIKGKLIWNLQKKLLENIDAVITDSLASKKDILKFVNISDKKVYPIYLAAAKEYKVIPSKSRLNAVIKKYNLPEKFVLYVGDATWNKNLPRLLEAVIKINVPLIMVGKALTQENVDAKHIWNKDLVSVQVMITKNSNIKPLGFISNEDLACLYNCATVFITPSLYEGFGLPLLEALSCGCACITTKEGSLPEIGGDAVLYVNPYDVNSIANGIAELFNNKNQRVILKEKGLKQAKKFSWEKTARETVAVYKNI